ncbi:MAG: ATP-binding protein [Myxococcota bacterium]
MELHLWRPARKLINVNHRVQLHAALEEALASAVREAILLQGNLLVRLGSLLDEEWFIIPILDTFRRILPEARGAVFISTGKVIAPLRELLGPCAELTIRHPPPEQRYALWQDALSELHSLPPFENSLGELSYRYSVSAGSIIEAADRAMFNARIRGVKKEQRLPLEFIDLAVRHQMQNKLHLLARPFTTSMTWDDVVLPEETMERLREMVNYGRNKRKVHEQWGFARLNTYGNGLTALFSGPPGTGKTLCAAIIARELGSELFMIDLSKVVDKYVGETEKNLGRIFDEAERSNVVLLFDEADSLFGKRTKVSSSNDRYANLEVNYLLQRMEHFPGTSILTTNLDTEMDEALQRRIRFRLAFKMPNATERKLLWRKLLPEAAPVADDIDFGQLANTFELTPAYIKNAILRAAFRAVQENRLIDHALLHDGAVAEFRDLGHLVQENQSRRRS